MTWTGAAGHTPPQKRGVTAGAPQSNGRVPDDLELVLAQASVSATEAVGGFAGGVYLRSGTEGLLRLAALAGLPNRLMRPWWRMHVNRPFPVAEAHRSGRAVHLADAEEATRRFPQLMAGLPFPFGSLYVPVVHGRERFGVLVVLRRATPGVPVDNGDRHRMHNAARRLGAALAALAEQGSPVEWDGEPVSVQLPAVITPRMRIGNFTWELETGAVTADDEMCAILGADPLKFTTIEALTERLSREDVYGLWTLARQAAESTRPLSRRMRLRGPDGRSHLLEISGQRADDSDSDIDIDKRHKVAGSLVDLGTVPMISEAADRLPRGVFSLDRLGRITYLNHRAETLFGHAAPELAGRILWEVVPWLANPAYEDYYRAALMSHSAVHFLARRGESEWLSVSLHPGHDGLTATLTPADKPSYTPRSVVTPGIGLGSPADRAAALYRPVALAIALTEAVTARQVSAVVTEELLPAFGGRQLAIYLLNERHLYLAWETGFPQGFLDRFDGVALDARLPGVETLTSGRPIFFESMQHLAAAYPGIPLDAHVGARAFLPLIASGRPVGSCILGFDQPRGFSPEERTVLTALAGLIAQALARAQRYDTEAALARGLQDALLPHRLPVLEKAGTVGRYLPGTEGMDVGGDWYDVVETGRPARAGHRGRAGSRCVRRRHHGPTAQRRTRLRAQRIRSGRGDERYEPAAHRPRPRAVRQLLLHRRRSGDRLHPGRTGRAPAAAAAARGRHDRRPRPGRRSRTRRRSRGHVSRHRIPPGAGRGARPVHRRTGGAAGDRHRHRHRAAAQHPRRVRTRPRWPRRPTG